MATYSEVSQKTSSEKILLCTVESAQVCKIFTLHSGSVYKRSVNYFVVGVKQSSTVYDQAANSTLAAGEFYYNPLTNELFIRTSDSSNPNTKEIIVFYRHFFSNAPLNLPYDLQETEETIKKVENAENIYKAMNNLPIAPEAKDTGK